MCAFFCYKCIYDTLITTWVTSNQRLSIISCRLNIPLRLFFFLLCVNLLFCRLFVVWFVSVFSTQSAKFRRCKIKADDRKNCRSGFKFIRSRIRLVFSPSLFSQLEHTVRIAFWANEMKEHLENGQYGFFLRNK